MSRRDAVIGLAGRALQAVRGAPLCILMYHAVLKRPLPLPDWCFIPAEEFAAQMAWLAERRIRVMPLVEAVAALKAGSLDGPTVAITFDDGYRNNLEVALPILERYGFPATIFLVTGLVDSNRALWPSRLNLALAGTDRRELTWHGATVPLTDPPARAAAHHVLQLTVKREAGSAPGEAVAEIEHALGMPVDPPVPRDSPFAIVSTADVARASASGLVEFGAHTITHPLVSRLDDARLAAEIEGSLSVVTVLTGQPCRSFAYPNGRSVDFDDRAVRLLAECSVEVAVTTVTGPNRRRADPLRLLRWGIGPGTAPLRFSAASHGLPTLFLSH